MDPDENPEKPDQDQGGSRAIKDVLEQIRLAGNVLVAVAQELTDLYDEDPDVIEKLGILGIPRRRLRRLISDRQAARMKILMAVTEDDEDRKT